MDYHSIYLDLISRFPDIEIKENHPLAPYTTVNIGGPADIFIHTKTSEEFLTILKNISELSKFQNLERNNKELGADDVFSARNHVSEAQRVSTEKILSSQNSGITILGNGSNVLISDSGIRGIVIKNTSTEITYLPNSQLSVASGVQLPFLINDTAAHNLSGLEEFTYIPSTLGGAIAGNIHGVNKNNFNKFVDTIEVFDLNTNTTSTLHSQDLTWDYDTSEFQSKPNLIIISTVLTLIPGNPETSRTLIKSIILQKTTTQSMNSLGSVFKNPSNDSAGRIIDQELGLKGFCLGDAQISPLHANFILNLGHATAADYFALVQKIQTEAKTKLNLQLEPEIKFLGNFN